MINLNQSNVKIKSLFIYFFGIQFIVLEKHFVLACFELKCLLEQPISQLCSQGAGERAIAPHWSANQNAE